MARRKSNSVPSGNSTQLTSVSNTSSNNQPTFEEQLKVLLTVLGMNAPPVDDKDKWVVIQDESYRPDKDAFILDKFIKDFPDINISGDPQIIYKLASRSTHLNDWLANTNMLYAKGSNIPVYYKNIITPETFEAISLEAQALSAANTKRAIAERDASNKYKAELEKVEQVYEKDTIGIVKTAAGFVLSLNSTCLPLTIQMAIEKYSPFDGQSPNQKVYAREMLVRYKTALLAMITKDTAIADVKKIVEGLTVK